MILEKIGFLLSEKLRCLPKNIFGDDAYNLVNKLVDVNTWPKLQNDKSICCPSIFKISTQQQNKWEVGHVFVTRILPPTKIPTFEYGPIYYTILGPIKFCKQYEVTIGNFPTCICIHFASMMTSSLGGHGKWVH
jgi:hypothetical protein